MLNFYAAAVLWLLIISGTAGGLFGSRAGFAMMLGGALAYFFIGPTEPKWNGVLGLSGFAP